MLPCLCLRLTVSRKGTNNYILMTWLVKWFEPLFLLIVKLVSFKSLHSEIYVFLRFYTLFWLWHSRTLYLHRKAYSGRFKTVSDKIWQYILSSEPRTRRTPVEHKSLVLQPRAPKAYGFKIVWPVDGWRPGGSTRIETGSTEYVSSLLATLTFNVCFCHSECSVHPLIDPPIIASTPLVSGSLLYATQPLYHFFPGRCCDISGKLFTPITLASVRPPLPLSEWFSS